MANVKELTADWSRSLIIDSAIDDELVKRLTPKILALRQASNEPITVGIDSPGGSLASLDVLLGLLTGPDQDGKVTQIITVATNRAFSAAANFLAFGTYAIALRHSQVLYHDVRYGGMEDVTPEKARDAARSLQDANDVFALRLAHRVIKRLVWAYIDLRTQFVTAQTKYPATYKRYSTFVSSYAPKVEGFEPPDLASFATCLWGKLSPANDVLIKNVMRRLARWVNLTGIARTAPTYRPKGSRVGGLLDGARHLNKLFSGRPEHFEASEEGLKLLLSLLVANISATKSERVNFSYVLDQASREFGILESMNDPKHVSYASDLLFNHPHIFLPLGKKLQDMTEDERAELLAKATPHARLLWHFCVLLCRELFEGEHILTPADAQLLGLVDEVSGGGPISTRRDFRVEQAKKAIEKKEAVG